MKKMVLKLTVAALVLTGLVGISSVTKDSADPGGGGRPGDSASIIKL